MAIPPLFGTFTLAPPLDPPAVAAQLPPFCSHSAHASGRFNFLLIICPVACGLHPTLVHPKTGPPHEPPLPHEPSCASHADRCLAACSSPPRTPSKAAPTPTSAPAMANTRRSCFGPRSTISTSTARSASSCPWSASDTPSASNSCGAWACRMYEINYNCYPCSALLIYL